MRALVLVGYEDCVSMLGSEGCSPRRVKDWVSISI